MLASAKETWEKSGFNRSFSQGADDFVDLVEALERRIRKVAPDVRDEFAAFISISDDADDDEIRKIFGALEKELLIALLVVKGYRVIRIANTDCDYFKYWIGWSEKISLPTSQQYDVLEYTVTNQKAILEALRLLEVL